MNGTAKTIAQDVVISPDAGSAAISIGELVRYRELLFFLTWRDIKVRYKQSILGIAWVAIKPLTSMVIFSIVFGRLARLPSEGIPYPVFVLLGLVPWGYFAATFSGSTGSIVSGGSLISKVYFPRLLIPVGNALSNMVDVAVAFAILLLVMRYHGIHPGPAALGAPLLVAFIAVTALGPGMLLAALFVKYRDVGHIAPFLVQIWLYLTPVIYPVSIIPERYRWLIYLNPMTGVIEAFRACFIPGRAVDFPMLGMSATISVTIFIACLYYFRSVERTFADII